MELRESSWRNVMLARSCRRSPEASLVRLGRFRLRLDDPSAWLELPLERLGEWGLSSVSIGAEVKKEAMLIPPKHLSLGQ